MKYTMKKLAASIAEGRGTGNLDSYKPWIQVTRRVSSPCSNPSVVPVPYLTRLTHYLSRGERVFALFIWWLGASDVREQYPLWPWEHRHPAMQLGGSHADRIHAGTRAIAADAGIALHDYPGLAVPWILSLDLLITVPASINHSRLVGVSCKPKLVLESGAPSDRELERLELDRRYCLHAEIPHHVAHPELLPRSLVARLHWLAPIESHSSLADLEASSQYRRFVEILGTTGYDRPAWIASQEAGKRVGWSIKEEQRAFKVALWNQDVDADISQPFTTTQPLSPGGIAFRALARNRWLGPK